MIHAYVATRGHNRSADARTIRHAVDEISHLCGAHDTACGREVVIDLGAWVDDDPRNCRRCARIISEPEEIPA